MVRCAPGRPVGERRLATLVALSVLLGGCSPGLAAGADGPAADRAQAPAPDDPARAEWLRSQLVERDGAPLVRAPDLVAEKYKRMARSQFAFFRGTVWLAPRTPSGFATPPSARIAVVGNPHPENVGIGADGDADQTLAFNDFDLAGYGSYLDDLRRLAVSFWILADMADLKHKQRVRLAGDVVDGYVAEVADLSDKKATRALAPADVFGGRGEAILTPPSEPDDLGRVEPASPDEERVARAVLAAVPRATSTWRAAPVGAPAAISVVSRHAGIASFPLVRLVVAPAGPPAGEGARLLEVKESRPGSAKTALTIERAFRHLRPDAPLPAWAAVGDREFRVHGMEPTSRRRFSAERIVKEVETRRASKDDLAQLAYQLGRLLARGHGTAVDRGGVAGLAAIRAAITSAEGLKTETIAYAEQAAAANKSDLRRFRELLAQRGQVLGWKAPAH